MAFLNNLITAIRKKTLDKTDLDEKLVDKVRGAFQTPVGKVVKGTAEATFNSVKPYLQNLATAGKQGLGVGLTAIGGYDPTPDFIQRPAGKWGMDLAEQALKERQEQKIVTPKQVLTRVPLNTARTMATVYGAAKAPVNAIPLTISGAIGAGTAKLQGKDVYEGAGKGIGQGFETLGFTSKVTDPTITALAGNAVGQVKRRLITGLGNVAEDELLAKLDDVQQGLGDRLMSFGLGAVLSSQANEDVVTGVKNFFKRLGNQFTPKQQKQVVDVISKQVQKNTTDKVQNLMRRIKITENGKQLDDILVPETRSLKQGSNQFANKYKDFTPAGSVGKGKVEFVEDPNNPRRLIPKDTELNAFGGMAGIETYQDEEGKTRVRYNPTKGAIGFVGGTMAKKALDNVKITKDLANTARSYGANEIMGEDDKYLAEWTMEQILSGGKNVGKHLEVVSKAGKPVPISSMFGSNPKNELDAILGKTDVSSAKTELDDILGTTKAIEPGNIPLKLPEGSYKAGTADEARAMIRKLAGEGRLGSAKVELEDNILKPGNKAIQLPAENMVAKNANDLRKLKKAYPNANISLPTNETPIKGFMPDDGNRQELSEIEKIIYGSATPEQTSLGGKKEGVGLASNLLRKGQEKISTTVGDLTTSTNPLVRNTARLLQGFSGGLGKTGEYMSKSAGYKGAVDYGNKIANDSQRYVAGIVGNSPESLKKIHSFLDPELADTKVKFEDMSPQEQEATGVLQKISDYINDTNYKNGFITKEKWQEGRGGKYLARAYEDYDFPPEIADFQKQRDLKFDLNPFKKREGVTDWKKENAVRDPSYLVAKRLQQTVFNDEVLKMSNYLKTQPNLVSDVARPGFEQLSDHKAWGELAGRYVRKDIVDDIKGFHFANDGVQKMYDVLNWWDKNPARRTRKQIMTVFNPAVRLGNKTGNYVFAWMSGINPATFSANRKWAKKAVNSNDELYRRMIKDGLVGGDASRADIQRFALDLKNEVDMNPELMAGNANSWIKRVIENAQKTYGETDDASKVAAMKTFLDRGYSYEEAAKRVLNSFQNYNTTGFLYDIGAKLPIFGNPFVRFQGDLMRILKNAAIDHPVRAAATLLAWQGFTKAMSAVSGENEEDRQTRENRVGNPKIPFTNISLAVQTPWGELNAARLVGIMSMTPVGGASVGNDLSKVMPFQSPDVRNLGSDPVIGPVLSTIADTDFRGKPISDPNQNKYTGSLLTDTEKNVNRAKYLLRSYLPPTANDLTDVFSAAKGEPNYYGQKRSLPQALLRLGGLKVEQFGAEEAQAARDREAMYAQSGVEAKQKQISTIKNQLQRGEIDEATATKRINAIQQQISQATGTIQGANESVTSKGAVKATGGTLAPSRVKTLNSLFGMPEGVSDQASALEKATNRTKVFKKINDVYDAEWMSDEEKISYIAQAIGITEDQAKYYGIARLTDEERLGYITDELSNVEEGKLVPYLASLRETVNDKQILTNSVIDDLNDAGVISDEQAKYLKKVKFNKSTGKLQYTGTEGSTARKKALELLKSDVEARSKLIDSLWSKKSTSTISNDINTILKTSKVSGSKRSEIDSILAKKRSFEASLGKEPQ